MSHFISFEGVEASGKTTQSQLLKDWLETYHQIPTIPVYEPGGTLIADKIRTLLLNTPSSSPKTDVLLFYAARMNLIEHVLQPALKKGNWIIADRYIDSTRVYQQSESDIVRTLEETLKPPIPSLTILLDLHPSIAVERLAKRPDLNHIDKQPLRFHEKIALAYKNLAAKEKSRFAVINADQKVEKIAQDVQNEVTSRLLTP